MRVNPDSWNSEPRSFLGHECTALLPHGDLQLAANVSILRLARQTGLPLLLTTDAHFVRPEEKLKQNIGLDNSTGGSMRFFNSYHHPTTAEAWANWSLRHDTGPEGRRAFTEAIENGYRLAEMAQAYSPFADKRYHLPPIDVPADLRLRTENEDERLERLTLRLVARYGRMPGAADPERRAQYAARLREELAVIARNGVINFLPYFLKVAEICQQARDSGNPTGPGRGSAAGCLLSYLLRITHLDPIRWNLSFARFLSMGRIRRGKFPDIDLDFGDQAAVAAWMKERHGDCMARVCTTGTLKPKSALKDAARVLLNTQDNPRLRDEVDAVTKGMPNVPQGMENMLGWMYGYEKDGTLYPGQVAENPVLADYLNRYPQIKAAVDELLGLPRSLGRHASGFCLSDVPIEEIVPTCVIGKDQDKETCTQFTKDQVEKLGLIKIDVLGVNTLKDIQGAINLVRERHGVALDIYDCDTFEGDPATYEAFCRGDNASVFQFNGPIPVELCRLVQPQCLNDLSQITANGRPGTMYATLEDGETTLIDAWVGRRQGKLPVSFVHPDLEEILADTQGVFVFQEQIAAAFQKSCGYTEERADEIREIVGKKQQDKMEKILPEIRERLTAGGWNERQRESFISLCIAASSYSFNRSHSAAYGYIALICQYLKVHYPLEWWTSVLQNAKKAEDLEEHARACREFLLPPDVNDSDLEFYILDGQREKIVYPLSRVKGVKGAGETVLRYRPFTSIEDFVERTPRTDAMLRADGVESGKVNKGVVSALIWSGAFDRLCNVQTPLERADVFRRYLDARGLRGKARRDAEAALPTDDFGALLLQNASLPLNAADFSGLIAKKLGVRVQDLAKLERCREGEFVRVAGFVAEARPHQDKKKRTMMFLTLVDKSHPVSVTVFADLYEKKKDLLKEGAVLLCAGKVNDYKGRRTIAADDAIGFGDVEVEADDQQPANANGNNRNETEEG